MPKIRTFALYGSEEALLSRNVFRYYSLQKEAAGIKLSEIERRIKY